jgi:hypothetical protein
MPLVWNLEGFSRVVRMRYVDPVAFAEWRDAHNASLPALSASLSVGMLIDRRGVPPLAAAFAQAIASYLAFHRNIFEGGGLRSSSRRPVTPAMAWPACKAI